MIYECDRWRWNSDPVQTEQYWFDKFRLLPPEMDFDYIAAPWAALLNDYALDSFEGPSTIRGITVCQHIRYKELLPKLKALGVVLLFTPHVDEDTEGMKVLPIAHLPASVPSAIGEKDLWYSFVGTASTHPVRECIAAIPHTGNVIIRLRDRWHFQRYFDMPGGPCIGEEERRNAIEYADILGRSRFSLCPRGTGASTIRFWESLKAGAVPVLISDLMRLPSFPGFKWEVAIVRIPESDAASFPSILRAIPERKEIEMRENCRRACQIFLETDYLKAALRELYQS